MKNHKQPIAQEMGSIHNTLRTWEQAQNQVFKAVRKGQKLKANLRPLGFRDNVPEGGCYDTKTSPLLQTKHSP